MTSKWNSRKFWSAWVLTVKVTILLIFGIVTEDTYMKLIGGLWLYWFGANHMDKRLKVNGDG